MKVIEPYHCSGHIDAMCSKSYLQRAIAIAGLADSETLLTHIRWSDDSEAARNAAKKLGATFNEKGDKLLIKPGKIWNAENLTLDVNESGLSLRMFACIAALFDFPIVISGAGSLLNRPLDSLLETLQKTGVDVKSTNGKLPLMIKGPLNGGIIKINGSFSSQIISGLLIALPLIKNDTVLEVAGLTSIPYVAMTLDIIRHFGVEIRHEQFKRFYIKGNQKYQGRTYQVEGDWSAAANFLVAAAISGELTVSGLNPVSKQADKAILLALESFGAEIRWQEKNLLVKQKEKKPFQFDATHCPDLFPPLVVLAAACSGTSRIRGTQRLLHKESDRLYTLIDTFHKLGVSLAAQGNDLLVHGTGSIKGNTISSHNDHRIAMAAAVAATLSEKEIKIKQAEAVNKSYPLYFEDLKTLME
ncbi:MAG: 3-phosphoshikimate 1-carboxyvinyltransferase [Bacteroidota bacterium]|nr:3-phosphoshikimate 1-carboxyvinyltransferase [Bacteroidota bacterium]